MQISNSYVDGMTKVMHNNMSTSVGGNANDNEKETAKVNQVKTQNADNHSLDQKNKENQSTEPKTTLEYSMHKETNTVMIKIVDKIDKTVIAELPPEKILDLVADMCKRNGLFIDEKR